MAGTKVGHGGTRKYGRNKEKCASYRASKRGEHNKAKRVLKSSGSAAYIAYCLKNGITSRK
jgi:hypothetical protein